LRYAILSDIHGNIWALDAVIKDAEKRNVDTYINLGDILYGPLELSATWELCKHLGALTISGNQDREIVEARQHVEKTTQMQRVLAKTTPEILNALEGLPATRIVDNQIFVCHGTPGNDAKYLLEDISSGIPRIKTSDEISNETASIPQKIILCGHSHLPNIVTLDSGQIIINPGSVGLPAYEDDAPVLHRMETYAPHASYAILETDAEAMKAEFFRIGYNHQAAASCAKKEGRTDWEYALLTGRAGNK